jgi:hypothetical protein
MNILKYTIKPRNKVRNTKSLTVVYHLGTISFQVEDLAAGTKNVVFEMNKSQNYLLKFFYL